MSGTGVTIRLDDRDTQARLASLAELLDGRSLAPTLREIRDELLSIRTERFITGRGVNGVPWPAKKRVVKGRDKTLVYSGRLRDGMGARIEGSTLTIGSVLPYAAIHEFGGQIRQHAYSRNIRFTTRRAVRKDDSVYQRTLFARNNDRAKKVTTKRVTFGERVINIPARPWLGIGREDLTAINAVIERRIAAITGGAPGGAAP